MSVPTIRRAVGSEKGTGDRDSQQVPDSPVWHGTGGALFFIAPTPGGEGRRRAGLPSSTP